MLVRLYMILLGFLSERYLPEPDVTLKDLNSRKIGKNNED